MRTGRPRLISGDIERKMLSLHTQGVSATGIARRLGFSVAGIAKALQRNGICIDDTISEDVAQKISDDYRSGLTGAIIANKFGVSRSSIVNILRRKGIKARIGRPPVLTANHDAFDQITEESAYWMGFLFADGSVGYTGTPMISLVLSAKDHAQLEAFRNFLGSSHNIREFVQPARTIGNYKIRATTTVAFTIRSARLVNALNRYGFCEKGSLRAPVPALAQSRHFWRGCVDGDGCVRISTGGGSSPNGRYADIGLCGYRPILRCFQKFLQQHNIASRICRIRDKPIFNIRRQGKDAERIVSLLYKNCRIALTRKRDIAERIMRGYK